MSRKPWTSHAHKTRGSVYKPPVRWSGWYAQWSTVEKKRKAESDRFRSDYIAGQTIKLRYFLSFSLSSSLSSSLFSSTSSSSLLSSSSLSLSLSLSLSFSLSLLLSSYNYSHIQEYIFLGGGGGKSLEHLFSNRWMIARQGRQKHFSRVEKIKMNCKW